MLHLQDKKFLWQEIKNFPNDVINELPELSQQVVLFCKKWLNNETDFLFHTSGSTGIPKPINLSRQQMQASAQATIRFLNLTSHEHILVCINTKMIGGAMMLVRAMELDCSATVITPNAKVLQELSPAHSFTFASFVPMQLAQAELEKIDNFKNILVGGSAVSFHLNKQFQQSKARVWHTYGMTETVSHIALRGVHKKYFTIIGDTEIKQDERNCLMIRGAVTDNKWITTNDVAQLHSNNEIEILGRADDIINSGGIKFFAKAIEALLEKSAPHISFFVSSVEDEKLGQKIIAVFEKELPEPKILDAWKKEITQNISAYAVPKQILVTPAFARTASGKINKTDTLKSIMRQG